jgi:hypothetical protein
MHVDLVDCFSCLVARVVPSSGTNLIGALLTFHLEQKQFQMSKYCVLLGFCLKEKAQQSHNSDCYIHSSEPIRMLGLEALILEATSY